MSLPKAIIMVTLDCVRPDHLGCYGYLGVDTPHMDRIAQEGAIFEQAVCQAPNTWVSHATIFTGCNPHKHGVRTHYAVLSEQVTTIAQALAAAGYATAAFPAHTLVGPAKGFDKGFDLFDLNPDDFRHSSAASDNLFYRDWDAMWAKGKEWMLAQDKPFFAWFHYMGTHWEPLESLSLPEEYRRHYSAYGQYFDGKISWADKECIGPIDAFLAENGLQEESILAIFSDHGDDLPGNDPPYVWGGHNQNLFDNVMKIALIMRAPGRLPAGVQVPEQTRSIDIMPTVLDLAGVSVPESCEGVSLAAYAQRPFTLPADAPTKYAIVENLPKGYLGIRTEKWKLIFTDRPEETPEPEPAKPAGTLAVLKSAAKSAAQVLRDNQEAVHPLVYKPFSLVYRAGRKVSSAEEPAPQPVQRKKRDHLSSPLAKGQLDEVRVFALYDLENDPDEAQDVAARHPEVVQQLQAQLAALVVAGRAAVMTELNAEEQALVEQQLKALGYL